MLLDTFLSRICCLYLALVYENKGVFSHILDVHFESLVEQKTQWARDSKKKVSFSSEVEPLEDEDEIEINKLLKCDFNLLKQKNSKERIEFANKVLSKAIDFNIREIFSVIFNNEPNYQLSDLNVRNLLKFKHINEI